MVFKYWNHHIEDVKPTVSSAFEYINVDYAVRACKWSKFSSKAARIAASVMCIKTLVQLGKVSRER
jgi:hypothetical protein